MSTTTSPVKLACLIDDDDVYINLIKKIIHARKLSEDLLIFKNGQEALDHFKVLSTQANDASFPEIILLDLNMPVMDGWSFLQEFGQIQKPESINTTLYIVSSSIDPYEIEKAKSFEDVEDYLAKPVNIDQFSDLFTRHSA